jgi:hypothetical protein
VKKREWLYRAVRTFLQAAGGYIAVNLTVYLAEGSGTAKLKNAIAGLAASALAAGIAAIMNGGLSDGNQKG